MKNRKYKKVNINNTSSWADENEYHFDTYSFDKRAYDNMVLAVRETEADVDFADSKVDWHFATTCLVFLTPTQQQQFQLVEEHTMRKGNETAQAFGHSWFIVNFAYENMTVFKIETFRQTFLLKNNGFGYCQFKDYPKWLKEQTNEDGDFVYFAHTKKPIVVKSMANGMSAELKAKADANGGMVKLTDVAKEIKAMIA